MAFGITPEGFNAKRLADIKEELDNKFKSEFGSSINLDARGPFGQLIGIMSEELSLLWELSEYTYNSQFPATAQGAGVDNSLDLVNLQRKVATKSVVQQTFYGLVGTVIPVGTEVSQSIDPNTIFQTVIAGTILAGTGQNNKQDIQFSSVPDAGTFIIDFDGEQTAPLAFNITDAQIETELENLSNVGAGNVSVIGDFTAGFIIIFQGSLAESAQPQITIPSNTLTNSSNAVTATPLTLDAGFETNVTVEAQSTETGPVDAPAASLNTLDSSIADVSSVTNIEDAVLGTDIESDADALARRSNSLAAPGHTTIPAIRADLLQIDGVVAVKIFENEDNVVDLAGRPPHSYEAVVQGGDQDTIFQSLLDSKGASIQTVGSLSKTLKDVQGFDKIIRFSRPVDVPIYLSFNVKTNSLYPVTGDAQVAAALLAFGEALNIGDDVVVFPQLVCALNDIPGVIDIEIKIATADFVAESTQVVTFINDATDLRVEAPLHGLSVGNRVKFSNTGGTLPSGLAPNTVYYVLEATTNNFKVGVDRLSDKISYLDGGSGTSSIEIGGFDENINIADNERADFDSGRITVTSF